MKKRMYILIIGFVAFCLNGCGKSSLPKGAEENEILTMNQVDQDKTMITVHYEYGVPYMDLETIIEEEFQDVDIVMVHDGSQNAAYPLRQNLVNGVERDLILSRSLPEISDIAPDYLLDLSTERFVGNYYLTAVDSCVNSDGKLYYVPGLSEVYGVVYDRTMFEENGWEVPHSYSEFVELIDTINHAGLKIVENVDGADKDVDVKAIQPSLKFADAFQIVFNTFAYEQVYRGAENQQWFLEYKDGKSSMVGHMEPAVDTFRRLAEDGIISVDDFEVRPRERSSMLYSCHSTAMIFENMNAYVTNQDYVTDESIRHEMGFFPFWTSDDPDSDYLYSIPGFYMAVNKSASEESPEKKKLLIEIMSYLSQPEIQERLVESGMQISNVSGVWTDTTGFGEEVQKTIQEGRVISNFYFAGTEENESVEWAMRDTACDLLEGKISADEWLKNADAARDAYLSGKKEQEVYGTSECTFTRLETAQLVGDMYRHETGAPIALVFVGSGCEGVNGFLYEGDITAESLQCISAARVVHGEKVGIATGTLTGQQIMDYLSGKEGISGENTGEHVVASGLLVEYAPWKEPGNRLISCKLPDGRELDPDTEYEVAYFAGSLKKVGEGEENPIVFPNEKILDGTWEEHFISWLQDMGGELKASELTTKLIWETR